VCRPVAVTALSLLAAGALHAQTYLEIGDSGAPISDLGERAIARPGPAFLGASEQDSAALASGSLKMFKNLHKNIDAPAGSRV
jgi:hypothetical protein